MKIKTLAIGAGIIAIGAFVYATAKRVYDAHTPGVGNADGGSTDNQRLGEGWDGNQHSWWENFLHSAGVK